MKPFALSKSTSIVPRIKAAKYDRHGAMYPTEEVNAYIAQEINQGNHIHQRETSMAQHFEQAASVLDETHARFNHALDQLMATEKNMSDQTRKVSGNIRKAANELGEGLMRIQKTAEFDKLERYVQLLERAAHAMTCLAELENTGRLDKIMTALK